MKTKTNPSRTVEYSTLDKGKQKLIRQYISSEEKSYREEFRSIAELIRRLNAYTEKFGIKEVQPGYVKALNEQYKSLGIPLTTPSAVFNAYNKAKAANWQPEAKAKAEKAENPIA